MQVRDGHAAWTVGSDFRIGRCCGNVAAHRAMGYNFCLSPPGRFPSGRVAQLAEQLTLNQ